MAKQYSDMTESELRARITELEGQLLWVLQGTVYSHGFKGDYGRYFGWWRRASLHRKEVQAAMRSLVRFGFWEAHPENDRYARPIEKDIEPGAS